MGLIYGNKYLLQENDIFKMPEGISIVYNEYINYSRLLESCVDEKEKSILEYKVSVLYEVSIEDIISKIKDLWDKFVAWVLKILDFIKEKINSIIEKSKKFKNDAKRYISKSLKKMTVEISALSPGTNDDDYVFDIEDISIFINFKSDYDIELSNAKEDYFQKKKEVEDKIEKIKSVSISDKFETRTFDVNNNNYGEILESILNYNARIQNISIKIQNKIKETTRTVKSIRSKLDREFENIKIDRNRGIVNQKDYDKKLAFLNNIINTDLRNFKEVMKHETTIGNECITICNKNMDVCKRILLAYTDTTEEELKSES